MKEYMNMNREELLKDYLKRWGYAQQCTSCGFVLSYSGTGQRQGCCGKEMSVVLPETNEKIS